MFTGLHVDAGVNPGRIAGELDFLRHAQLAGRSESGRGSGVLPGGRNRRMLGLRRGILTSKVGAQTER